MKKTLAVLVLAIMLLMSVMTVVNASSSATLANELYAIGSKYGMPEAKRVEIERYLSEYPLSNEDCDRILALAQEADQIMIDNGTTDYYSLPAEVKAKLKTLANEAAKIAGVTLEFTSHDVRVYKDGVLYTVVSYNPSKPAYTGNNVNTALVVSLVAVTALAATGITVLVKKRLAANA